MVGQSLVRISRHRALTAVAVMTLVFVVAMPTAVAGPANRPAPHVANDTSSTSPIASEAGPLPGATPPACPWVDSTEPPATRAGMVVAKMSLWQLDDMVHRIQGSYTGNTAAIPSLCVPALTINDASAGVSDGMKGVTQLPAPVSVAATWNPSEANQYGSVVGRELTGKGIDVGQGPTVDIVRDPRWGRAFETYGEDPYLSGQIAASEVRGMQSQGAIAMVKHFALYNQETYRTLSTTTDVVTDRVAHEIYLPPYQAAIQQGGAGALMCSYIAINRVGACQDPYLTNILYGQWHFGGYVQSDDGATRSTVAAANAGLEDMESHGSFFVLPLVTAVEEHEVAIKTLRTMATRVLTSMFKFGLFNRKLTGTPQTV